MLLLRKPEDSTLVSDAYIRALLSQRFQEITIDGYSHEELGLFVLVEPGDTVAEIEQASGAWIVTSLFAESSYGDPDFAPCFEFLERHVGQCFELVEIMNDAGYGVIVIIPEVEGIDPVLMQFCHEYAETADSLQLPGTGDLYAPGH